MIKFSQIIDEIDAELSHQYIPGAIAWIDKNHNNAWSDTIDEYDRNFSACMARYDLASADAATIRYRDKTIELLRKYKTHKNMDEVSSFLEALNFGERNTG